MAKQQTEEELNIRRRARRRLVGAIALALAVVVILPMVLDSEPKPTGQDISLLIPAPDKAGEFVPGVVASDVPETASQAGSAAVAAPLAASEVVAPVVPAAASAAVVAGKISSEKIVNSQVVTQVKPEAVPASRPVETKHPEPGPADKQAAAYIVQVGAFSNAATARQEADKLKAWGFKAYTEKIGGTMRVRVGPYQERGKADEVRKLLEKHGLHPDVTAVNGQGK